VYETAEIIPITKTQKTPEATYLKMTFHIPE
jgi:hypothetical protein